ncbi:MAG: hypothetical protein NZM44_02665 [Candidatus Calescibacterium sp.]|nr:hypothetical protein [Candidatus Calescibacterium sp.]
MINTLENLNRFLGAFDINDIQAKCLDFRLRLEQNEIDINSITINSITTFHNQIAYSIDDLEILERYLKIKSEIAELIKFYEAYPSYFEKKRELEKKSATHLFGNLAERLIDYYSNNSNDLGTLRKLF